MPATNPPADPAAAQQWVVDREAIRNLIHNFGICVDDKDSVGYAANFTEDAVLELPGGRFEGRAAIEKLPSPPKEWTAQHLFGHIIIDLDGDRATTRAYLLATHMFDPDDITQNAHAGGWYRHEVVRTPDGWRFAHVKLEVVWEGDRPMIPGRDPIKDGVAAAH